jgi:hypothetical protein
MTSDKFCFYLQNILIQTSETGGQWYSDTSPLSIPCFDYHFIVAAASVIDASVVTADVSAAAF